MTEKAFEREVLANLSAQRLARPDMRAEDEIKFVFQALLGVGHLLGERGAVSAYIGREMRGLRPDPGEALTEELSPLWCRLNLRRAMAEGLTPEIIAGLMLHPAPETAFTREDVRSLCRELPGADGAGLAEILREDWLPSHSAEYRAAYAPAYRVIRTDWIPALGAVAAAARALREKERILVTLDGPCASGKTTLAAELAEVLGAAAAHTDDFVVPHAEKTPERLARPGGNCDAERLRAELLEPWKREGKARFRRYDCHGDRLLPAEELPGRRVLILEGSYVNLPSLRALADVRLYLDTDRAVRERRLLARESPASLALYRERWIPLEESYFSAFGLPDEGCIVIRGERDGDA